MHKQRNSNGSHSRHEADSPAGREVTELKRRNKQLERKVERQAKAMPSPNSLETLSLLKNAAGKTGPMAVSMIHRHLQSTFPKAAQRLNMEKERAERKHVATGVQLGFDALSTH
jgi:hypothetical protein